MSSDEPLTCAICGDEVTYDLAGMPTHVSRPGDHEPVERWDATPRDR